MDPQVEDQQQQEIIVLKVSLPSSRFNYTRLTLHQSIYEHDFIDVPPPKAWKVGRGRPEVHHTGADVAPPLRPLPDCPNSRFESLIPIPSTQRRYTSIYTPSESLSSAISMYAGTPGLQPPSNKRPKHFAKSVTSRQWMVRKSCGVHTRA